MSTSNEHKLPALAQRIFDQLQSLGNTGIASHSQRFFKTGPGQYGEGDRFLGIRVPQLRQAVQRLRDTDLSTAIVLLQSPWHEVRLFALLLMVNRFERCPDEQEKIYTLYLANSNHINNWDLVDSSAPRIVGVWLLDRDRRVLQQLARSDSLWERRIAIMASFRFIREHQFSDTLALSRILLADPHDLIHKAVGWMLREVGKRNLEAERSFLDQHYQQMPRTMLRYAIEKLDEPLRLRYLRGEI